MYIDFSVTEPLLGTAQQYCVMPVCVSKKVLCYSYFVLLLLAAIYASRPTKPLSVNIRRVVYIHILCTTPSKSVCVYIHK